MRKLLLGLVAALVGWATPSQAQQNAAPVVAVFTIQDKTGAHSAEALQQFTEFLTAKMAEGGQFQVVPNSQVKERLVQQKKESYKECYDEKCQIDLGRELAAQKSLSTQIVKVGTACVLVSTLFDLRRAVSEAAASEKGGCGKDDIGTLFERVAASLKAQAQLRAGPGVGGLLVKSNPPGAEVFLDGSNANGTTPLSIPFVKEGEHALMVTKGDYRYVGKVKVLANQIVTASCEMELVSAAAEREKAERERKLIEIRRTIAAARRERRSKTVWGLTAVGIAGAAAVTLGVLYGVGFSTRSDADTKYMAATTQDEMNRHWSAVERGNRMVLAGHVLAGVGGAVLVFSLYELLSRPREPEGTGDRRPLSLSVGGTGIALSGTW